MGRLVNTRNTKDSVSCSEAILYGSPLQGGLYTPYHFPQVSVSNMIYKSYSETAYDVLKDFLCDYDQDLLQESIGKAYGNRFNPSFTMKLSKLEKAHICELFHGPTLAFKDFALSLLPYLMKDAFTMHRKNDHEKLLILTSTSGDTGKAAMEAFKDIENIELFVFYPQDGVSSIQKLQMQTGRGKNVCACAVTSDFDAIQGEVKRMFTDLPLRNQLAKQHIFFSSANSINIGRLLPQIVYYFRTYADLLKNREIEDKEEVNFAVPTGNFGNILAGYFAKRMGLPIADLICVNNENHSLTDFLTTGNYNLNRPFYQTISPSIDILISSNLERYIFYQYGETKCNAWYQQLENNQVFQVDRFKQTDFRAAYVKEKEVLTTMKEVFDQEGVMLDPHTAVAYAGIEKMENNGKKTIVLGTASPFKFPKAVFRALNRSYHDLEEMALLMHTDVPKQLKELSKLPILHEQVVSVHQMEKFVLNRILCR